MVDCKYSSGDGSHHDFNQLIDQKSWPMNLTTRTSTPPSTTIETILISVCKKLPKSTSPSCPDGTLVCMYVYNEMNSVERLEKIIPIGIDKSRPLIQGGGKENKDPIQIVIPGDMYNGIQQSAIFTLTCSESQSTKSKPTTQYNPVEGQLKVFWSTPAACSSSSRQKATDSVDFLSLLRVISWVLFGSLLAYFTIGCWNNYTTYGASGWDLIPHQYFWRGLPTMLYNLIWFRSGYSGSRSRSGYSTI